MKRVLADLGAALLISTAIAVTVGAAIVGFIYLLVRP